MHFFCQKPSFKSKFILGKQLAKGGFSSVHEATDKVTNDKFAVKIINTKKDSEIAVVKKEIAILKKMRHKNIVQVFDNFEQNRTVLSSHKFFIVMELVSGGDLLTHLEKNKRLSEEEVCKILRTLLKVVDYIHRHGIVHRDLKPENILLPESGDFSQLKVVDFGLSKSFETDFDPLKTVCGSPAYVAPEILRKKGYGKEVDMWSVGVIAYFLLCGEFPFYNENRQAMFKQIMMGQYTFPQSTPDFNLSDQAKDFIHRLLVINPKSRMTASAALQHPWLKIVLPPSPMLKKRSEVFTARSGIHNKWPRFKSAILMVDAIRAACGVGEAD